MVPSMNPNVGSRGWVPRLGSQGLKAGPMYQFQGCLPWFGPKADSDDVDSSLGPKLGSKVGSQDWVLTRVFMVPSQD